MTDPYRDSPQEVPADVPRDPGIVGDVIAQFADAKAFLRELVQNSIDAGTPSIQIELHHDANAQQMHVTVRDRGEGMTREIVENQLLVLFRSTKERDPTKIGKFGIGFVSVLAPNPDVVIVQTVRDKRRIALHLYRDLTYELFDAGPATQNGTSVELHIPLAVDEVDAFIRDSELALVRWCRHASVPIELSARGSTRRIDRPLGIEDAVIAVQRTVDDGQLTAIVGIVVGKPYAGFFNHGLMLHETSSLFGKLAVKIQDARLGHTISRDDVRRDDHYRRAVQLVEELAERELPAAIASAMAIAVDDDLERYHALLDAVVYAGVELEREQWRFSVVEPFRGRMSIAANEIAAGLVWGSASSTPLTKLVAAQGVPIVRTAHATVGVALRQSLRVMVRDVAAELTAITPVNESDGDVALLRLLDELFDRVHRSPTAIVLAKLDGVFADRLAISGTSENAHVVNPEQAMRNPFALLRRGVLALSVAHPHVRAARSGDPIVASSHLARAVLLQHGLLDDDRSHAIVDYVLERVGVGR